MTGFLSKAGASVDEAQATSVVDALKGKQLHELIAQGTPKLASLSFGGGSGAAPAQTTAAPAKGGAPAPKVEEPPKEEENVSMGGLFD